MELLRSPEEVNITVREATKADLSPLEAFLSRPDIDGLFTPALSDPARGITIKERVEKKFKEGIWVVAVREDSVVGCMAVIPSKLKTEVAPPSPKMKDAISEGISFADWKTEKVMELSTVVTDQKLLKDTLKVKGVGAKLLEQTKQWVKNGGHGKWGFVTDSWVGGDMGGFVSAMNAKAFSARSKEGEISPDTLMRIYTDPAKRGENGPPTVVYGIPIEEEDWRFFNSKQPDIHKLERAYADLEKKYIA